MRFDAPTIQLKTSVDVARIRRSCRVAENTLRHLGQFIRPGKTTGELDRIAEKFIIDCGAVPVLKGYNGFPCSICASVNNVASHGIPGLYQLADGDVVTLDVTVSVDGWFGDSAWTYIVGKDSPRNKRLIKAAWRSLVAGIMHARAGESFGDIGYAVDQAAQNLGCSVIREYVGHGIGRSMHEEPRVPHFGERGTGMRIVAGMVFTIEPIVSLGAPETTVIDDGWTVVTEDNSMTAQFEHTIAVFKDRFEILTLSSQNISECLDYPPLI